MSYRLLCITDQSDLPETELFIGLKGAGVDITVMSNPAGKNYERLKKSQVPVRALALKSRLDPAGIKTISAQLKQNDFDIMYCFNNRAASNAILASRKRPIHIVTYRGTVGNVSFLSPASWTTHLHPRVGLIVCVSHAVRKYLVNLRLLGMRIPPSKVVTIYKGHDPAWYTHPPADLSEFGIPRDAFVVGFAGRNRPHKGIDILVDSARWLPETASVHFLLMGDLKKDAQLCRKIAQSPFKKKIHLTGYRRDVPALVAACGTFIMPSTKREGLSRAVIEAMACKTPPIVSEAGGLPELVVNGESGLVVPVKDPQAIAKAISTLCHHPKKREEMGAAALERIQTRFNVATTVRETKTALERLIGQTD